MGNYQVAKHEMTIINLISFLFFVQQSFVDNWMDDSIYC